MGELRLLLLFFFQNGILRLTNSPSMDVDFITAEGDLLQEYSCFISPGGDRDCVSRAVDLRIRTIPGMHLHPKSSTQLAYHSTTIMILTVSVGGRL